MAEIKETLKKLTYENIKQFVEDINRNFAIIQNSPLYKGIPGTPGDKGDKGLRGERGSRFFFIKIEDFLSQYPGEIVNVNAINQVWINNQLKDLAKRNKLLNILGISSFVDCDVIVLSTSRMIQYDAINDVFTDTGISFYYQSNILSSIETKIESLVRQYIDNNPKILSIKNLLIHYQTYAKVYSSTNNSYISQDDSDSAVYMPYFAGITDTQGALINDHTYFGLSDEEYPIKNRGSFIIGSVAKFSTLLNKTLSTTERSTFSSDFAPNKNNIPNLIIMQDTLNNGIMFGYKENQNLSRFASIYKDSDTSGTNEYYNNNLESHNLILKSDQGANPSDFSKLLINRFRMRYDKQVFFDDNLTVAKDFYLIGNVQNKFIRTAEFIESKYTEATDDIKKLRAKTIEIGSREAGAIQINVSDVIELPKFADEKQIVVLTVERPTSNAKLSKKYIVEEGKFIESSNQNLDDYSFTPKFPDKIAEAFTTTEQMLKFIQKINNIQQYIKETYWRREEWLSTTRGDANNVIPALNVGNTKINLDSFTVFNGTTRNTTEPLFTADGTSNTLTFGFRKSTTNQTQVLFPSYNTRFFLYDLASQNITKTNRQGKQLLTADDNGNLTNTGVFVANGTNVNKLFNLDNLFVTNADDPDTLITVETLGNFQNLLVAKFKTINDIYWKKTDYATTWDSLSNNVKVGNIPNIYVKNALGGKYLEVLQHKFNDTDSVLTPKNQALIQTPKIILDSISINFPKHITNTGKKQVLVTSPTGLLYQAERDVYTIETVELPEISYEDLKNKVFREINIIDADHHILTSEYLKWINNYLKLIVVNGLGEDFWKKADFIGDENNNYLIPTLNLKESLNVTGSVSFYDKNKRSKYFQIQDNVLLLGHLENASGGFTNTEVNLLSKSVKFTDESFKNIILGTWGTNDIEEDNDEETKTYSESVTKIAHKAGEIRKDIKLCTDKGTTENYDNEVPENSNDTVRNEINAPADKKKTKDKHRILTGRTLKWIMTFMNNVKKRFADTFNKTESMQHMHDILPVGSIIMWTKTSYDLACLKDPLFASKKSRSGIPNGWWPCNGTKIADTNLTAPDMRNQFVRGVTNIDNANGTGGRDYYKLKEGQLPNLKHTHGMEQSGNHSHLLVTKESDVAMYTGEFVYKNDLSSTETVRQKMGSACDENAAYNEGSPIQITKTNYVKLKNLKVPVVVGKIATDNLLAKNNWVAAGFEKTVNTIDNEQGFVFKSATTAGISLYDFVKDFLSGNAFEISNMQGTGDNAIDVSKHRHEINQAGLGMSTEEKQGLIYTVPSYYKVIYIMKYDNSVNPNSDPIPDPIEIVADLPANDGTAYVVPEPDQKDDSVNKKQFTINVVSNVAECNASINGSTTTLSIIEGDYITLNAIAGPTTATYYWQLRHWTCDGTILNDSFDTVNSVKIGKDNYSVVPTKNCTYTAVFEKIDIEPEPPAPTIINPNITVKTNVSLDGYEVSDIDHIDFDFKGESGVSTVTIETTKDS